MTTADEQQVIDEFPASGGRVSGVLAGTPLLLLHHVGARTGAHRVTPLAYSCHGAGRLVVVASNGGADTHPSWLHNLRAHPDARIDVSGASVPVRATEPDDDERDALWAEVTGSYPDVGRFQARTRRTIPLVVLRRRPGTAAGDR